MVMTMMATAIRVRRNHRTSENDDCNGSKKKCAQLHDELPLRQPFSRMVCTLQEEYLVPYSFATDFSINSPFRA